MHGGDSEYVEPNLTPLLDLVLQLVMFFMICANFVMEQLNAQIQLPEATNAKPIDREQKEILTVNIDRDGDMIVEVISKPNGEPLHGTWKTTKTTVGDKEVEEKSLVIRDPLSTINYFQYHLGKFKDRGDNVEKITVIIRPHKTAAFEHLHRVMYSAKQVGFKNIQIRANVPKKG